MSNGKKIFISHSSKDQEYVDAFIQLLKKFGFRTQDIFYSSTIETGVQPGELIFDTIKRELTNQPVMLYFLSDHYYQSIPCLNEMGASWMLSDKHYPIALNNFSMKDMKGVISSERLAIAFNDKTSTNEINCLLKKLSHDTDVQAEPDFELNVEKNIQPFQNKLTQLIRQASYLKPDEKGYFETILSTHRPVYGTAKGVYDCFKLPSLIEPKSLGLDTLSEDERHWLFFFLTWGTFQEGEKVRFKLKKDKAYNNREFSDIGKCKNIYVSYLEKVE